MIKHIIFDLAEVLLTGIKETGINLGKKHKIDFALIPGGSTEVPNPLMVPAVWNFFHGDISENKYIAEVLKVYPQFGLREDLKHHIRENFIEIEGTREIILKIRRLGYSLALLSVHGREWIEYCDDTYDIHSLFDLVVYSYMDKVSKPQPEAFIHTLRRLHAEPNECVFVDDSKMNIEAAQRLGIVSRLFTDAPSLTMELDQLLHDFR